MIEPTKISVIPKPNKINILEGSFVLGSKLQILTPMRLESPAKYLKDLLNSFCKLECEFITNYKEFASPSELNSVKNEKSATSLKKRIVLGYIASPDNTPLGNEGYILDVSTDDIIIKANAPAGAFYAVQTIRQLLLGQSRKNNSNPFELPCMVVEDIPRFPWRGYMLDEGRHFHGMDTVKKMLDVMALLKLNTFHWHLSEDQGWRVQIKKYPKLTEIGSKRKFTQTGGYLSKKFNNIPHEGFYTQDQIKEIIAYARDRYITVIPEIDIPGHSTSALASYPEYSCTGGPFEVSPKFGVHKEIYCVGKETTFHFIEDILSELMSLFPSPIIHIGGDEVPKDRWKLCPDCQKRMQTENFKDVEQLQGYFTNRIAAFLKKNNRQTIGWNEILKSDVPPDVITQFWLGSRNLLLNKIRKGGKAVMCPFKYVYLDHTYAFTSLDKAYSFEPIPKNLEPEFHKSILGTEGLMWNEWVPTTKRLHWRTFPRLIAYAEIGWTEANNKNLTDFKTRLDVLLNIFDDINVGYAPKKEWNPHWFIQLVGIGTVLSAPKRPKD